MTRSQVFNQDGTNQVATYGQDAPGTNTSAMSQRSISTAVNLPSAQPIANLPKGPENINWLGSSFSGADIKVVAHLYNSIKSQASVIENLSQEKFNYRQTVQMLNKYIQGGINRFLTAKHKLEVTAQGNPDPALRTVTWDQLKAVWLRVGISNEPRETGDGSANSTKPFSFQAKTTAIQYLYRLLQRGGINREAVKTAMEKEKQGLENFIKSLDERIRYLTKFQDEATDTAVLGTLQTLSIQTHREKFGVRALGKSYVKGYTRGPRTIAGSMVFTIFNEHALTRLIKAIGNAAFIGESKFDTNVSTLIPDQLPPLDLTIVYANEYGSISRQTIYGVEFVNDGQTMSIEDLFTEQVMNFVARDVDIMTSIGTRKLSQTERGLWADDKGEPLEGTALLNKTMFAGRNAYQEYLVRLGVRRSLRGS